MTLPEKLHLIGIGGAGMSALAFLLKEMGFDVSGTDPALDPDLQNKLQSAGIKAFLKHSSENLKGRDVVVISSAIPERNEELQVALRMGVPVVHRVDVLCRLARVKRTIAVAGTHGKGTTTAMIGYIFQESGFAPSFYDGAELINYGKRSWVGEGKHFILETDESDASFLKIQPASAVITNVDRDHLNFWGEFQALKDGFRKFASRASENLVLSEGAQEDLRLERSRACLYGLAPKSDFQLVQALPQGTGLKVKFLFQGKKWDFPLPLLGEHNALNALGAVAMAFLEGIEIDRSLSALSSFKGVKRRLELKGEKGGVLIFDDHADHPTEIFRTLNALRPLNRRTVCVVQPHRYSRLKSLLNLYGQAFEFADAVFVLPVFSAGEEIDYGMTGKEVKEAINIAFPQKMAQFLDREELFKKLRITLRKGDLLIFMGPGDIDKLSERAMFELND